jgi:hypothetical protein
MFVRDVKPYTWVQLDIGKVCWVLSRNNSALTVISLRDNGIKTWSFSPEEEFFRYTAALYEYHNALMILFEDEKWLNK